MHLDQAGVLGSDIHLSLCLLVYFFRGCGSIALGHIVTISRVPKPIFISFSYSIFFFPSISLCLFVGALWNVQILNTYIFAFAGYLLYNICNPMV